ncbi:hypothetical protein [Streptomyces sp. AC495_CC817]|uniref:hypothetical protein n=1 Tax=Streptomyces sp. AC495_CC817 TaxID=2823900 RepID=UPI001C27491A|nr:hypothetical protein [Streptomyces sp. AC495_CC817]
MPSRGLHPDKLLSIEVSCVLSRNKFTKDPAGVIGELLRTAGDRRDLLTTEVGMFLGAVDGRTEGPYCRPLIDALRALELDTEAAEQLARERLSVPQMTTRGFNGPWGPG